MDDYDIYASLDSYDPNMDTSSEYELLPVGEYVMQIEEANQIRKDNGNVMLKLQLAVMTGPLEGRKHFENLNIRHSNVQAQEIAQKAFTQLWRDALQLPDPEWRDIRNYTFKPLRVKIRHSKRKDTGDMQAQVSAYLPMSGSPPAGKPAQPAPSRATAPAATEDRRPAFLKKTA